MNRVGEERLGELLNEKCEFVDSQARSQGKGSDTAWAQCICRVVSKLKHEGGQLLVEYSHVTFCQEGLADILGLLS